MTSNGPENYFFTKRIIALNPKPKVKLNPGPDLPFTTKSFIKLEIALGKVKTVRQEEAIKKKTFKGKRSKS